MTQIRYFHTHPFSILHPRLYRIKKHLPLCYNIYIMKKEILLAIILGVLTALGITFFIYQNNQKATSSPTPTPTPVVETLPEKSTSPINFTSPENEAVFENRAIVITGTAPANSPIIVFVNRQDFFTQSDDTGNWSLDLNLESGSNTIIATFVNDLGESFSDERLVIYTNKSLEETLVSDDEIE